MLRLGLLLIVLLAQVPAAQAQELWALTRAGMSVADVKKLYPAATAPSLPAPQRSAVRVLLAIPEYTFEDEAYRVAFFFRGDKLEKVVLNYLHDTNFEELAPVYASVLQRLRSRYGKEASSRSDRSPTIKNEEHTWLLERTNVQMNMTSFVDGKALFAIRYQTKAVQ